MLSFEVKFYPSDPSQITDEQSRFVTICYLRQSIWNVQWNLYLNLAIVNYLPTNSCMWLISWLLLLLRIWCGKHYLKLVAANLFLFIYIDFIYSFVFSQLLLELYFVFFNFKIVFFFVNCSCLEFCGCICSDKTKLMELLQHAN